MKELKTTFITTVLNEGKTIEKLLESLGKQTELPDEIIVVDGGSTDKTLSVISNFQFPISNKKIISKKGNRSIGRNEAVKNASNDIILSGDAGCILDNDWVKKIKEPFKNKDVDVVAGYNEGLPGSVFQKCLVPYVLVMPDKVNPNTYLPASRSMAFTKSAWKKVGGFPEKYSHNEDYVFAKRLKKIRANIVFNKEAVVYWLPRKNIKEAFYMFYRFARGDSQARIIRPKVILIFTRYIVMLGLFILTIYLKTKILLYLLLFLLLLYLIWSVNKNYKYVKDLKAIFILPTLQISSDLAVILGTLRGLIKI